MEGTYLLAMRGPAFRRHDSYLGFRTQLENRVGDVKGKGASGRPTRPKVRMHRSGAHCLVRAMKRGNARGAKGQVIHVKLESTGNRRNSSLGGSPAGLPWGGTSRMRREFHVRICEGLGVKFPGPTRRTGQPVSLPRSTVTCCRSAIRLSGGLEAVNKAKEQHPEGLKKPMQQ